MRLSLTDIRVDETIQARVALNAATVSVYADDLRRGDKFPPVVIFKDAEEVLWLADGFHRYHAHVAADIPDIEVDLRDGSYRDARMFAIGANHKHGLPRTNEDKRKAVKMLLDDADRRGQTDAALATLAGVSGAFVGNVRREWESLNGLGTPVRTTRDGRQLNTSNLGRRVKTAVGGGLREAINFAKGSISKRDFPPEVTCFHIADRRILAFDGWIASSAPIDFDLTCRPAAEEFIHAVNDLGEPLHATIMRAGLLELSAGGSKRSVATTDRLIQNVHPAGQTYAAPADLLATLETLKPFISEDASKPEFCGVLFDGPRASANGREKGVFVEKTLPEPFPVSINLPHELVTELLRIRRALNTTPTSFQTDGATITFHFPGDRWLHGKLSPLWPQGTEAPLRSVERCVPVPEGFFQAVERLKGHGEYVYLKPGQVTTTPDPEYKAGATEVVPGVGDWGRYKPEYLLLLKGVARSFDLSAYPDPAPFTDGDALRGVILGGTPWEPPPPKSPPEPPPPWAAGPPAGASTPCLDQLVADFGLQRVGDSATIGEVDAKRLLDHLRDVTPGQYAFKPPFPT